MSAPARALSRNPLRRLYDWTLAWAYRPSGEVALWIMAAAEAVFFPIPPDVLLVPLTLGRRERAWRFALGCTLASVAGGLLGYTIGRAFWEATRDLFIPAVFSQEAFDRICGLYQDHAALAVFAAAFTPIPYKVFTVAGGVAAVALVPFLAASAVGRGMRFFAVAALVWWLGEPARRFIDRWFNWLCVLLFVLLLAGFLLVDYWA